MNREFVGRGWKFPILPGPSGRLEYTAGDENVEHSLRVLLLTSLGERVMRFNFGSRASELVFAPGGQRHLRLLETTVREAVRDWEPRIDLLDVSVEADLEEPERVNVSLSYQIRASNTRSNLVFPFYLDMVEVV
ncbi:GPW/gp25 family protein [Stieleria varia]|uniref:Lysozyme-like protein n=1 Tax=Stieleria varia TaxID=2528005 RepID=A0A5C5ZVY4_9BACT|nr:GPW/gp25 family protein [Stieleria varia]TWT91744.1 lysozyme-like protein [Stieleria varia]